MSVTETAGSQLTVYSSLPLQGPTAAVSQQIVDGEKLALSQAGGHVGSLKVAYASLDDSNPTTGRWSTELTSENAKTAAQDTSTIAYLGDYSSAATAISLPLVNAAGILQVSPASPYVGLTSSLDAGQDEPDRFYPSGRRNFGRLQGGDPVQAAAQVALMKALGVRRVYVLDDQDPFQSPLASIVAEAAARTGIDVLAHDSIPVHEGASFAGEIAKVRQAAPQAVMFAGADGPGAVALWRALHEADPRLTLLGTSSLVEEPFTSQIGVAAAAQTYLTTPVLAPSLYPPAARRVLSDFRRTFDLAPTPYALYGYEAMSVVLDAIRRAGSRGNDRQAVIDAFLATRDRESVLGRYSMRPDGEPTFSRYAADRVVGGVPVFYRAFDTAAP